MNRNHIRRVLGTSMILMAIVACVLPGQYAQPAPAMDPMSIDTAVAGTMQAAATRTAEAGVIALATEAPVMTGTAIEQTPEGTTRYSDYDAGFEIVFPVGWLAVRPNSDEFNATLANVGANTMLQDQMTTDQTGYEAKFDRLFAYPLRPDIQNDVIFGFSKLAWNPEDATTIDDYTMGKLVEDLESPDGIPGFRAGVVQLHEDGSFNMIEISGRWTLDDGQGNTIPFYTTVIFFKPSSNSTVRLTFTYLHDHQGQIAPDVKSIMESISPPQP